MLGRGLESLIPNKENNNISEQGLSADRSEFYNKRGRDNINHSVYQPTNNEQESGTIKGDAVFQIEVEKIKSNPHQPRKVFDENLLNELAASIREVGIIQPLVVSKKERDTDTGTVVEYELIAGERRLMAAKRLGLERVPAIVRKVGQEKERLEVAIIENVQRADLNPIEAARSYSKLQEEFGLTQREVAARVGKSRETISNVMRLLNLPSYIQEAIANKKISDSQGRLLLALDDLSQQQKIFEEIINNNLSVRELRAKIAGIKRPHSAPANNISTSGVLSKNPEFAVIEERLQEVLGTKVSLQTTSHGGRIMISFFSPEEFQEIVNKIIPNGSQQI